MIKNSHSFGALFSRKYENIKDPYEKLKEFTRGREKAITTDEYDEDTGLDAGQCEAGSAKYNLEMGPDARKKAMKKLHKLESVFNFTFTYLIAILGHGIVSVRAD